MRLHFVDQNQDVVAALGRAFSSFPEVTVSFGDILDVAEVSVVSPANSYGFMDGGIDAVYRRHFGQQIEDKVRAAVAARPEGYLPLGTSLVIPTGNNRIPYMIVAPTMLMPEAVSAFNAARALRAVIRAQAAHASLLTDVYCPGLCTGVGQVEPDEAAAAMAVAYRESKK
ncbi:AraC family transcriptional regulator [Nibricoccus aquaticus]|uniref:AraC family transcriptional regulator n=1 Tax=Nibricoccus aquaticus TaxID=2576891 RepID=A0A290Q3H3_9BACT|nr:macro domain-containing protein [Nibricoccus aquaticus]ATC63219.1 AraC family transcriptional regulator [Nibricoccus aquaticus]